MTNRNMTNGERIYNFSAGPAVLPIPVIEKVQQNLLSFEGSGLGVMELSHRGAQFTEIIGRAKSRLAALIDLPENYEILFCTGGASNQFSMIPLNLAGKDQTADYLVTGSWSKKAAKEAKKFCEVRIAGTTEDCNFTKLPTDLDLSSQSRYVHFTSNNTIFGTQFAAEPNTGDIPLVCDASSDFLHKKVDISKYGLIYAGAQKNLGPAGVTIVIVRKDLIRDDLNIPTMLDYNTYAANNSLYNTPPTFPIYVFSEVLEWLSSQGGLASIEQKNREKAAVLYNYVAESSLFNCPVAEADRSIMNVVFTLSDDSKTPDFLAGAKQRGLSELKGHRSVGGCRASIYNAFPKEGIEALVDYMKEFEG